uniref:Uncharacterized protein n=2 Tax=unclassified Caudoviricetes TaxID=2788787 RepID=A0AB39AC08_9CAUD
MNTEELKEIIAEGERDATDLLNERCPKLYRQFDKHADALAKLLKEVKEHFPDARYYTSGGDGFVLVLGETHSGYNESPNNELVALTSTTLNVQGGDW